jgi:hypothetical protein
MKNTPFIIFSALLFFCACQPNNSGVKTVVHSDSIKDSILNTDSGENEFPEYELYYVVNVVEGYNYDSLRQIAKEVSRFITYRYDSLDRYYNYKRKKIVYPDNYEDEIYAGDYLFRRYSDSIVSLEMRNAYADTATEKNEAAHERFYADSTKLFVFADMFASKAEAEQLAARLKQKFKHTTLIPANIFMGCMH